MSEEKSGKLSDVEQRRFTHIGIVVKSVDETIKYFQQMFGFEDFEVRYVDYPTATYYGKVEGYKGKRGFFYLGPIQVELIELVSGKTIHEDFLKTKGEGLHHLGFSVDDIEHVKQHAEKAGFQVIQSCTRPDGTGFSYIDSDKVGGVIFEMSQRPKQS